MKITTESSGELSVVSRLLLACGFLGPLLNVVMVMVLGAASPSYSAWQMPDSLLELGPGGWMQIANYFATGILLVIFAFGVRRALGSGRGSTWGSFLLGLYGLTFIGAAIFVTDPQIGFPPGASTAPSIHGTLHNLFGQFQFISLSLACLVLARRDAGPARVWVRYSFFTGLVILASDVLFILTFESGGPAGLVERLGIVGGGAWIAVLAFSLASKRR